MIKHIPYKTCLLALLWLCCTRTRAAAPKRQQSQQRPPSVVHAVPSNTLLCYNACPLIPAQLSWLTMPTSHGIPWTGNTSMMVGQPIGGDTEQERCMRRVLEHGQQARGYQQVLKHSKVLKAEVTMYKRIYEDACNTIIALRKENEQLKQRLGLQQPKSQELSTHAAPAAKHIIPDISQEDILAKYLFNNFTQLYTQLQEFVHPVAVPFFKESYSNSKRHAIVNLIKNNIEKVLQHRQKLFLRRKRLYLLVFVVKYHQRRIYIIRAKKSKRETYNIYRIYSSTTLKEAQEIFDLSSTVMQKIDALPPLDLLDLRGAAPVHFDRRCRFALTKHHRALGIAASLQKSLQHYVVSLLNQRNGHKHIVAHHGYYNSQERLTPEMLFVIEIPQKHRRNGLKQYNVMLTQRSHMTYKVIYTVSMNPRELKEKVNYYTLLYQIIYPNVAYKPCAIQQAYDAQAPSF